MHEPRFTRLTMVRLGGGGGPVRRYGLARLDEIALASPPRSPAARHHVPGEPSGISDRIAPEDRRD